MRDTPIGERDLEAEAAETASAIDETAAFLAQRARLAGRTPAARLRDTLHQLALAAQEAGRAPAVAADPELRAAWREMMEAPDIPAFAGRLDSLIRRLDRAGRLERPASEIIGIDPGARRAALAAAFGAEDAGSGGRARRRRMKL